MPRTTISRSSLITLLLALAAAPAVANAQEKPASHTVRPGDTLWDLSKRYLGDPFQWPKIYRLNTDVVEDPHWIYPGEVLRLVPGEGVKAVPAEDTPAPAAPAETPVQQPERVQQQPGEYEYPMPEFAKRKSAGSTEGLRAYTETKSSVLHPGEFYSAGFLTEGRTLVSGRMLGPIQPPQIRFMREGQPALQFEVVGIRPAAGVSYAVGDTLTVFQRENGFEGFGDLVIPTGLVRITRHVEHQDLAEVIKVFGPIRYGQEVMPVEKFSPGPKELPVPTSDTLTGTVLGAQQLQELKVLNTRMFIDLGRQQGVATGDVFEIRRVPGPRQAGADNVDDLMAKGLVIHVGERTATLQLVKVISPDIPAGMTARRVAKLPS